MLAKAPSLAADALILDLEDAVPVEAKESARELVREWLEQTPTRADRLVRINPLDTPWGRGDLAATFPARPDAFVVPKVESRADLDQLDSLLTELERAHGAAAGSTPVIAIATETPRALLRIAEIADGPRLAGLTWGAEDLSAALGAQATRSEDGCYLEVFRYARQMTLLAAHAAGVAAIDGVFTDLGDSAGLELEAREAATTGFTGKLTIHPAQIGVVNDAFTPAGEAISEARALLAAYEEQRAEGRGAFAFRGQMVDAPHIARARVLLARAER